MKGYPGWAGTGTGTGERKTRVSPDVEQREDRIEMENPARGFAEETRRTRTYYV